MKLYNFNFPIVFCIATFLSFFFQNSEANAQERKYQDLTNREIASAFQDIVRGRELYPFTGPMISWADKTIFVEPIFAEAKLQSYQDDAEPHLKKIISIVSRNSDFDYSLVGPEENDKLSRGFVIYGDKEEILTISDMLFSRLKFKPWEKVFEVLKAQNGPYCTVTVIGDQNNETIVFVVTIEEGSFLTACIYEELLQSTGLINDTSMDIPSIMGGNPDIIVPTVLDELFLRLLSQLDRGNSGKLTISEIEKQVEKLRKQR